MGVNLTFEVEGEKQISAELGIIYDGIRDFSEPMEKAADIMFDGVDDNFNTRGSRFGGWAPRKDTKPHPLLEETGKMRRRMRKTSGKDFAMIDNPDPKFPYHQSNQARKSNLPRRVMIMIDDRMRDEIFKAVQLYVVMLMRGRR